MSPQPILIDEATAGAVVTSAILDGLSDYQRQMLTEQVLTWLMTAPPTAHGIPAVLSPLQRAMRDAVVKVVDQVAIKIVSENADLLDKITELINTEVLHAIEADHTGLGGRIRLAVAQVLTDRGLGR